MYLTYEQYVSLGGGLDESTFSVLEFRAEKVLDQITFGRLQKDTVFSETVQRTMLEIIRLYAAADDVLLTGAVKSESNDGYSIDLLEDSIITPSKADKLAGDVIERYLIGEKNQDGEYLLSRWV